MDRLRGLRDPMGREIVAWVSAEIVGKPEQVLAERDGLVAAGAAATLPDLCRHFRARLNLPFKARDLLAAWDDEQLPAPDVQPVPRPARGSAHAGAVDPDRALPGEVIWQPNLGPPPGGMGVTALDEWPLMAGDGVRLAFVDHGYQAAHPDYRELEVLELGSPDPVRRSHGTWTLGVLCARPMHQGMTGICPRVQPVFVRSERKRGAEGWVYSSADAVRRASQALRPGDVLLLAHEWQGVPAEQDPATFDAIRLAVAAGQHVVQAAGQADRDLDHPDLAGLFDRHQRDSGAIVVTGYLRRPQPPPLSPTRIRGSHGSRVDAHAPAPIYTSKPTDTRRRVVQWFQGTSSAATQVAGVVAVASALAQRRLGRTIAPGRMRALLSSTGTPPSVEADRGRAGTQPNLPRLLAAILGSSN